MHRPDVGAMLEELDSDQLSEWMAYLRVDHSQALRGAAMVSATLANVMGNGKRQWAEADFLPRPRTGPAVEQSPEDMRASLMSIAPVTESD